MKRWALLLLLFTVGCVEPEAGYVKVILDNRTDKPEVVTYFSYYNPLHQDVYVYSTDPIDVAWGLSEDTLDARFGFTTKEGVNLTSGAELRFRIPAEQVPVLVAEHERSQERFIRSRLWRHAEQALDQEALKTEASGFFGPKRLEFQNRVAKRLQTRLLEREGVLLQEFRLKGLWFPKEIQDMVKSRIHAEQEARKAEAQIAMKKAEAAQTMIVLESEMAAAKKWSEINRELSESLTSELIQYLVLRNERVLNQECPVFP